MNLTHIRTLGELKKSGYKTRSVKDEIRDNLITAIKRGKNPFPGIVGYNNSVIPAIQNALLAKQNFILLGLRGQAKSRILRQLVNLLDEYIPVIDGCSINDSPYNPLCKRCHLLVEKEKDLTPVRWLERTSRYSEKLATPDVTVSDLIGDIDPIKAANMKLDLSDENVILYGIIPRTNRGIFGINELPDLNTRIQVSLLNLLEEGDVQFRGFPVRLNLDMLLVFTANPEDYTNRGTIITPLKDRIDSQILTHYPASIKEAKKITRQESWLKRESDINIYIPEIIYDTIEEITMEARESELVDQTSGVSQRVSIAAAEAVYSNVEKRAIITNETSAVARIIDLYAVIPALIGKIQLVYEGEQKGLNSVAKRIIGRAINNSFTRIFPHVYNTQKKESRGQEETEDDSIYNQIVGWFATGNTLEISDISASKNYMDALEQIPGLTNLISSLFPNIRIEENYLYSELLLEGLFQNSLIGKDELDNSVTYKDVLQTML